MLSKSLTFELNSVTCELRQPQARRQLPHLDCGFFCPSFLCDTSHMCDATFAYVTAGKQCKVTDAVERRSGVIGHICILFLFFLDAKPAE